MEIRQDKSYLRNIITDQIQFQKNFTKTEPLLQEC